MSWHYLQEREEACWDQPYLVGAPSALLRLIPTAGTGSLTDSGTDACHNSPSGTMSAPSTGNPGADTSMLSVEGSPAKTSAQRVKVNEYKEYIFTFGHGQKHFGYFHAIKAKDSMKAREEMCRRYGLKWSMQYESREAAGVEEYKLKEMK